MNKPFKKIAKLPKHYLLAIPTEADYEKAKLQYIADYTEENTNFLSSRYTHRPDVGAAKWDNSYPNGYHSWVGSNMKSFNGFGQRKLVEKINEIVTALNDLQPSDSPSGGLGHDKAQGNTGGIR